MPQITVSYSKNVEPFFDGEGFARDLHQIMSVMVNASLEDCKARFIPVDRWFMGDGTTEAGLVHVEIGLLDGRPETVRNELGRVASEILAGKVAPGVPEGTQLTVEIREIHRASFGKRVL